MSFDFEVKQKTKIKVSIYDQQYEMVKPTVAQAKQLVKFSKDGDESDGLDKTIEFMEMLGLPKDVSIAMEIDHFTKLVEYITGQVKKN